MHSSTVTFILQTTCITIAIMVTSHFAREKGRKEVYTGAYTCATIPNGEISCFPTKDVKK